jgi:hypothetical protein
LLVLYYNKIFFLLFIVWVLWISLAPKSLILENMSRMSIEERRIAIGMLQAGRSIRDINFWRWFMLLSIILFL